MILCRDFLGFGLTFAFRLFAWVGLCNFGCFGYLMLVYCLDWFAAFGDLKFVLL